jgi:hypothetical protein
LQTLALPSIDEHERKLAERILNALLAQGISCAVVSPRNPDDTRVLQ